MKTIYLIILKMLLQMMLDGEDSRFKVCKCDNLLIRFMTAYGAPKRLYLSTYKISKLCCISLLFSWGWFGLLKKKNVLREMYEYLDEI